MKKIQLADWSGIVLASGDGLIFEVTASMIFSFGLDHVCVLDQVINGLMSRDDWREALRLPIGHLPGGSGNAFITNVLHHSKYDVDRSAGFRFIRCRCVDNP